MAASRYHSPNYLRTSLIQQLQIFVLLLVSVIINALLLVNVEPNDKSYELTTETMQFKGFDWYVRKDGVGNPGNNTWRLNNVAVDADGKLRLRIVQQNGVWTCAEFGTNEKLGYGEYIFTVENMLNWDKNVVAAGFKYLDDSNELDIELTKWGNLTTNAGFTVQPEPYVASNHIKFNLPIDIPNTRHIIHHYPNDISFRIEKQDGTELWGWKYTGTHVPEEMQYFVFQLWLVQGKPPSNNKPAELIISDFKFVPMSGPTPVPVPTPGTDVPEVVKDLRDELASQKKLSAIRAIAYGTETNLKKISGIKAIL
jgi:hypothetical protein